MKKNALICSFAGLILGFGALVNAPHLQAASPAAMDECSKELLLSYFPETFVNDSLKRFNIPQEKWAGINAALSSKDKDIIKIVEQRASSMNPNPLKDPQQRQAAVKLFRETLLQVFSDALKENGIQDNSQFQAMLDDIQQQKAKKFAQCMEKQKELLQQQENQPAPASPLASNAKNVNSDDDNDKDDDDNDDDDDDSNDDSDDEDDSKDASTKNSNADLSNPSDKE